MQAKFLKPGLTFASETRGPNHGVMLHASLIFACKALDLSYGGALFKPSLIFEFKFRRQLLKWDTLRVQG